MPRRLVERPVPRRGRRGGPAARLRRGGDRAARRQSEHVLGRDRLRRRDRAAAAARPPRAHRRHPAADHGQPGGAAGVGVAGEVCGQEGRAHRRRRRAPGDDRGAEAPEHHRRRFGVGGALPQFDQPAAQPRAAARASEARPEEAVDDRGQHGAAAAAARAVGPLPPRPRQARQVRAARRLLLRGVERDALAVRARQHGAQLLLQRRADRAPPTAVGEGPLPLVALAQPGTRPAPPRPLSSTSTSAASVRRSPPSPVASLRSPTSSACSST